MSHRDTERDSLVNNNSSSNSNGDVKANPGRMMDDPDPGDFNEGRNIGGVGGNGGSEDVDKKKNWKKSKRLLGLGALLGCVFIWVASGEMIQFIFKDQDFNSPFFLTYFSTSLFSLYLLGFLIPPLKWRWWASPLPSPSPSTSSLPPSRRTSSYSSTNDAPAPLKPAPSSLSLRWKNKTRKNPYNQLVEEDVENRGPGGASVAATSVVSGGGGGDGEVGDSVFQVGCIDGDHVDERVDAVDNEETDNDAMDMVPAMDLLRAAAIITPIYTFVNYTYNLSLIWTSVSSSSVLSATSGLWTLLFGVIASVEKFSVSKLIASIVCLVGVVIVSRIDSQDSDDGGSGGGSGGDTSGTGTGANGDHALWGDFLALLSAVGYAVYAVLLKYLIPDEDRVHMPMFLGLVGLTNLLLLWPFGIFLHITGIEVFHLPPGPVCISLLINGLIGTVVSDYLWMMSVLFMSPLIGTLGLLLTIPISIVADLILGNLTVNIWYIAGSALICCGFLAVNLDKHIRRWLSSLHPVFARLTFGHGHPGHEDGPHVSVSAPDEDSDPTHA
eukprot:TRINITY_DN537_c0_g2_i1.p1 TRINITY_DN537_c0_g2~~TRINITY_DN537_c0_g2_i1.p1  ORF type:complete len:553 (-),score=129.02 TRINITY_DN537_c0_g2_i1:181-1839(-)